MDTGRPARPIANPHLHIGIHVLARRSPRYGLHNPNAPPEIIMLNAVSDELPPSIEM